MYGFKAIVLDVDGTLADTERDGHRPAFNAAFAEAGLDWSWDVERYGRLLAVTGGKERIRQYMEDEGIAVPAGDSDSFVADLHRAKTRHYLTRLERGDIPLRPGVLRLLKEAREARIALAIATTTTPENVAALLEHCGEPGVLGWFDTIAAGDAVPAKKPAPDIYLLVLKRMGLEPRDCVAVEDSDNGARSALDAGLSALVVTESPYTRGQDFSGAALVVDGLGEPEAPARALSGSLFGAACVDLGVLARVHRRVWSSADGRD